MDREKTSAMEIDTVLEAFKDFEEKRKTEVCPVLEQFLCRVAKTGETMVQWSQFKSYFLFKLEKVIDDFRASAPEQRGTTVSNVDSIPFEEMKDRILKIVNGYSGIPFTIQRLCELLMEPKRNYTGTDKFLRGVEKNVMVVSCVYPTSDKNGNGNVNRMNGFLFPGNPLAFSDRNVNGPGTPRPPSRPKLSLSGSLATNGHPDFTASPERVTGHGDRPLSDSSPLEGGFLGNPVKNKHQDDDDDDDDDGGGEGPTQAEQQEVKRLKFDHDHDHEQDQDHDEDEDTPRGEQQEVKRLKFDQDQDHDEDAPRGEQQEVKRLKFDQDQDQDQDQNQDHDATQAEEPEGKFELDEEEDKEKESACPVPAESLSGMTEEEASDVPGVKEEEYKSRGDSEPASSPACVNQEPSGTEREPLLPDHKGEKAEPESSERPEGVSEMGQSGQQAPPTSVVLQEVSEGSKAHELVSSSSGSVETGTSEASNQPLSPEPAAQTGDEPMEQD